MIDEKTTIGEIGSLIFKQIRKESAKEFIKTISISDNIIKMNVFNVKLEGSGLEGTEVIVKFSINGKEYEERDTTYGSDNENVHYHIKDGIFITRRIMTQIRDVIWYEIGEILQKG